MANDRFGNKIEQGDFVEIDLSQRYVIGHILQIKPGGVIVGKAPNGQPIVSADVLILACEFNASPPLNQAIKKMYGMPDKKPLIISDN